MHLYICFTNRRLINTLDMFYKAILWQFCCILSTTSRLELIFLLPWRIGSSNPGLGGIVNSLNCSLWVRVDCESNAIQAHLITAGSARLSVRPIKEAVQPWKILWGALRKAMETGIPCRGSLYSPHENIKMKGKQQQINGKVRNLRRMIDGTNKMRNISKRLKGNSKSLRGAQLTLLYIGRTEVIQL